MTFALVFLVNAGLSFALAFVVAGLIGPEAFGRYGVALALSVVVATAGFEWLRLCTTRFGSDEACAAEPGIGATLRAAYAGTTGLVVAGAGLVLLLGPDLGLPRPLVAVSVAAGIAIGLFDRRAAEARARFRDRRYAALLLLRGLLAFALAAGAAALWGDPAAILAGSVAAALLAPALLRDRTPPVPAGRADGRRLAAFARYAVPVVAAGALYGLMPLLGRAVLADRAGFATAAAFALAGETAMRLFQNLGAALDLALFQLAIRAGERDGPAAAEAQARRNLAFVVAIVLPAAAGLCVVWPAFESLVAPAAFQGRMTGAALLCIPAFGAFAILQYGLAQLFQLRDRTGPVVAAALAAPAVSGALLLGFPTVADPTGIAAIQLAGFGASLAVLTASAARLGPPLPWRDASAAAAATGLMVAALWPWRDALPPAAALPVQVLVGAAVYGVACLALDVAGIREGTAGLHRRLSARP